MINTSANWKTYANNSSVFHIKATMSGGSTLNLTDTDFMMGTASFTDSISGANAIEFGAVVTNSFSATLNNATGKFDNWDWDTITVYFGVVYSDSTEEWIKRGTYSIDRPDSIGDTIRIECYDAMDKLNKYFGGYTHTPPVAAYRFVELICQYCGVTFGNWNIDSSWNVGVLPDDLDESTTCRQMISWVLATCGGYARINPTTNALDCNTWSRGGSWGGGVSLDGGIESPWSGAGNADGGVMNPWGVVTSYDGGTMAGGGGSDYTLTKIKNVTTYIDNITLTGVRAFEYNTVDSFNIATAGTDGYVINIMDNPFCDSSSLQTIADRAYANMGGLTVRPFNINAFGDPSIEAGDRIDFVDSRNNQYTSVITNLTYTLGSDMLISCDVEAPAENEIEKANAQTSTIKGAVVASYDYLVAKKIAAEAIKAGTLGVNGTITTNDLVVQNGSQLGGFSVVGTHLEANYTVPHTYTSSDVSRLTSIINESITPTQEDYDLYDITGDGYFDIVDLAIINRAVLRNEGQLSTSIKIDPSSFTGIIETGGAQMGGASVVATQGTFSDLRVNGTRMTDHVISDVSAGGTTGWRKWAGGTSEYWATLTQTITNWGAWGNLYEATPGVRASYPADLFIEAPKVYALPSASSGGGISGVETYDVGTTTNSPYFYALRPSTASIQSVKIFVYAVGKWK